MVEIIIDFPLQAECPTATEIAVRGTRETRSSPLACKPKMLIIMRLRGEPIRPHLEIGPF